MRSALFVCAGLLVATAGGPACVDGGPAEEPDLVAGAPVAGTDEGGKADQPDIVFRTLEAFTPARLGATEEVRIVRSARSFKSFFGADPPAGVNFAAEWLAFYSPGPELTGGFVPAILRVRLTDSGATLKIATRLDVPGSDCAPAQRPTHPFTLVRFPKPQTPDARYVRYTRAEVIRRCQPPLCAADLQVALEEATVGLLFTSESDRPFATVAFPGAGSGPATPEEIAELTGAPPGTATGTESVDDFFAGPTAEDPDMSDEDRAVAERFRALRALLEANLADLTVIRIGTIQIQVYLVGRTACGDLAGVTTVSIET